MDAGGGDRRGRPCERDRGSSFLALLVSRSRRFRQSSPIRDAARIRRTHRKDPRQVSSGGFAWQPSLFAVESEVSFDRQFSKLRRIDLDHESWVDFVPGWVSGSDTLFEEIIEARNWGQRRRRMYEQKVLEPRLTAPWNARSGEPLEPPVLEGIRQALSHRYEREFDSVGFNLYRDGRDSVAWHSDRIHKDI